RYYDPTTQRFLSQDPIGFNSGDFNFYRYVGNSPGNFTDPSGLWAPQAVVAIGYISWQFYSWIQNDLNPSFKKAKNASNLKELCLNAILSNDPNASETCSQSSVSQQDALKSILKTTSKAGYLPGTLGGGPLPTTISDVISSEVQGELR
ncbi:MAG: hypothetical protein DRG78_10020, partial [Epsilonproteobacteria bacterium]